MEAFGIETVLFELSTENCPVFSGQSQLPEHLLGLLGLHPPRRPFLGHTHPSRRTARRRQRRSSHRRSPWAFPDTSPRCDTGGRRCCSVLGTLAPLLGSSWLALPGPGPARSIAETECTPGSLSVGLRFRLQGKHCQCKRVPRRLIQGFTFALNWGPISALRSVVTPDSAAPWTAAHQAPLYTGLSRQEHWGGLPCSPPGDLPHPGIKLVSPAPVNCRWILYCEPPGKPHIDNDKKVTAPSFMNKYNSENIVCDRTLRIIQWHWVKSINENIFLRWTW